MSNKQINTFTIEELDYIEKYYKIKSDSELAKELNKTECQIKTQRYRLGLKKQRQTFNKEAPEGMKWCWYCNMFHSIEEFSKNKNKIDGYQDECKRAVKQMVLDRKIKNKKKNIAKTNIKEKICLECKEKKSINNFIKNASTKDGYSNLCIDCLNKKETTIKKYKIMEGK